MDNSVIKFSDLIGSDETFDEILGNIRTLKKELKELADIAKKNVSLINPNDEKAIEAAIKDVNDLAKAKKMLEEEEKAAIKTKKQLNQLTEEELILREKQKIENRERVQRAKQLAILRNSEKGSIASLRAQLSLVTLQWKKLSDEERENGKVGKSLVSQKKNLTEQLKRLEKQTGDTRRNVGNYTDSLGRLGKVAARVFVGRSIVDGIRKIGQAIGTLIDRNKDTDESIAALDDSLGEFTNTLLDAGGKLLSFVAKPLTLLIKGATNVIKFFSGAITQVKAFSATSEELVGVTEKINQEFTEEKATVDRLFTSLKKTNEGSKQRKDLVQAINQQYGKYLPNLLTERSTLADIEVAQRLVNEQLSKNFALKIQNATQTDIFTNKIKAQNDAFEVLRNRFERAGIEVDASLNPAFSELLDKFNDVSDFSNKEGQLIRELFSAWGLGVDRLADEVEGTNPKLAELARLISKFRTDAGSDAFSVFSDTIERLARESDKYNAAAGESSSIIDELNKGLITGNSVTSTNTKEVIDNTKAIEDNNDARIKAIETLQLQILQVEAENLEDRQEQAFRFEDLRFKAEQKQREENFDKFIQLVEKQEELLIQQFGKNSQEVIEFRKKAAEELRAVEELNLKLEQEQLEKSEQKKLDIRKEFALKTNEIEAISVVDDSQEEFNKKLKEELEEKQKLIEQDQALSLKKQQEATEQQKKNTEQLLSDIGKTSEKISAKIVELFEKQAELAGKLVDDQAEAVETQRQRAEQGLDNTLKFEQEQLAKREAEQIRAEQRAKQAAKILALFNLVSAYAANGDENALARGLVDFALLQAFEAGFKDGGYTGNSATDSVAGHVHGQEYVVTAEDTAKYGLKGKKGNEFGEAMSDYFNQGSPLLNNHFGSQRTDFENGIQVVNNTFDVSGLQSEFKKLRQSFERMPRQEFDVVWLTDYVIELTKKTVRNNMTKVEKARRKL